MTVGAFICGCAGTGLDERERAFIRNANPWGLILFARNVETPGQVLRLTSEFRELTGRGDAPVLVDQEGGRIQRLGPPHWLSYPPAAAFDSLYRRDPLAALKRVRLITQRIGDDLRQCGITVDCLPVLDVPQPGAHEVIGDRAYGDAVERVVALAQAATAGLMAAGVLPVIKHLPGHGRANADSHTDLPVVDAARRDLEETDFVPFAAMAGAPMAMTAHVVYSALDPDRPATLSRVVVQSVIRERIGFDGLLMTDDISMKALQGPVSSDVERALEAGCDIALHCNGDMAEMEAVAAAAGALQGESLRRGERALLFARAPDPIDRDAVAALVADLAG